MIIARSPLRISFFGGSTDYESFYKDHGAFLIGTTINKYTNLAIRFRPKFLTNVSQISYSKLQCVDDFKKIYNPLIRETLLYKKVDKAIELFSFADIPSRTGLGGSSSYCVTLLYIIDQLYNITSSLEKMAREAIYVERERLKEAGGIQDQIWATYGGFNTIEIESSGKFFVKSLPITPEFKHEMEKSIVLIYTGDQRYKNTIATSHENKDKTNILKLAKESYNYFIKEDIKTIGELLYYTWQEKRNISKIISNDTIDDIVETVINLGAYGAKLLGSGGSGFVLVICNSLAKKKIIKTFQKQILDIEFENKGVTNIYKN